MKPLMNADERGLDRAAEVPSRPSAATEMFVNHESHASHEFDPRCSLFYSCHSRYSLFLSSCLSLSCNAFVDNARQKDKMLRLRSAL